MFHIYFMEAPEKSDFYTTKKLGCARTVNSGVSVFQRTEDLNVKESKTKSRREGKEERLEPEIGSKWGLIMERESDFNHGNICSGGKVISVARAVSQLPKLEAALPTSSLRVQSGATKRHDHAPGRDCRRSRVKAVTYAPRTLFTNVS
ncbi:hypothetical protein EVAR_21730_1 [Eumeta japonica]|uniref:Uncharacterized protein n=1 Tax=Eumeta variegata TaxID=151549 RepID=A0A4C1W8V4_EUMVA|nr:hypothetical protein EVAR_21730_1 [Eumeta japonica]